MELTSLKDVKSIVAAVIEYGMNGQEVDLPEHLRFGWKCIQSQIDQSKEYSEFLNNPEFNNNLFNIKNNNLNNFNIKNQEKNLKEEKENNTKEKKKTGSETENESADAADNFKKWTCEMFCDSVDEAIAKSPEYSCFRDDFIRYWTEPDPKGKMKFQIQQTWRTAGRLATWAKNNPAVWNNSSSNNNNNSEGSYGRYVPRNG